MIVSTIKIWYIWTSQLYQKKKKKQEKSHIIADIHLMRYHETVLRIYVLDISIFIWITKHSEANKRRNLIKSANFEHVGFCVLYLKTLAWNSICQWLKRSVIFSGKQDRLDSIIPAKLASEMRILATNLLEPFTSFALQTKGTGFRNFLNITLRGILQFPITNRKHWDLTKYPLQIEIFQKNYVVHCKLIKSYTKRSMKFRVHCMTQA